MATAPPKRPLKSAPPEFTFIWEGKDRAGKLIKGEMRSSGESMVQSSLRRKGILPTKVKKAAIKRGKKITGKDIAVFTRQLATMMRAGVPMLQAFDIVSKGHANPSMTKMLTSIKSDVEQGNSLQSAFKKYPNYFDPLFCNLVGAGEAAGILDMLLERLASYQEKMIAIKGKIKSALTYPIAIMGVALIVVAVIMIFVIPAFKEIFSSFGAELPAPTLIVMAMSDFMVKWWWLVFGIMGGAIYFFLQTWKRSPAFAAKMDIFMLKIPVFGELIRKSSLARWSRTLSTMFSAGVPMIEALDSVGGASGNHVYLMATRDIQNEISSGTALAVAMQNTGQFPNLAVQMTAIGEESGALEDMLNKVADFYDQEVDEMVDSLSALMEPMIMVILGVLVGGMVVAMYLPIFKLGAVV